MHWSAALVGLPWKDKGRGRDGVDCWGLTRLAFATRGIALPGYDGFYQDVRERDEVAALLRLSSDWPWTPVVPGAEDDLDIAIFRRGRLESHIGTVTERGAMLHIVEGSESCVERYDNGRWARRLVGFYRHAEMA